MRAWIRRALCVLALLGASAAALPAEASESLRLRVLVVVYRHTFTDRATRGEIANLRREVDQAARALWRGSRSRLHVAVDWVTVERVVPETDFMRGTQRGHYWLSDRSRAGRVVERDLTRLGVPRDVHDVIGVFYAWRNGPGHRSSYGGASWGVNRLMGKAAYFAIPMAWKRDTLDRYFEHELLHTLMAIFRANGHPAPDVDYTRTARRAWVLQDLPDAYFTSSGRWGTPEPRALAVAASEARDARLARRAAGVPWP